ncbi:MAG: hypothetical protein SGARI_006819, partial [Bacillariaceae sp.]
MPSGYQDLPSDVPSASPSASIAPSEWQSDNPTASLSVSSINDAMPFEEALAWVEKTSQELDIPDDIKSELSSNKDIYDATWLAKSVGKAIFSKMKGTALNFVWDLIFPSGESGPTIGDVLTSLDEVKDQINDLGLALIRRFAESDFRHAHRATIESIEIVRFYSRLVEQNRTDVDDATISLWAHNNAQAASVLTGFLTNPISGAIPIMNELYAI